MAYSELGIGNSSVACLYRVLLWSKNPVVYSRACRVLRFNMSNVGRLGVGTDGTDKQGTQFGPDDFDVPFRPSKVALNPSRPSRTCWSKFQEYPKNDSIAHRCVVFPETWCLKNTGISLIPPAKVWLLERDHQRCYWRRNRSSHLNRFARRPEGQRDYCGVYYVVVLYPGCSNSLWCGYSGQRPALELV